MAGRRIGANKSFYCVEFHIPVTVCAVLFGARTATADVGQEVVSRD